MGWRTFFSVGKKFRATNKVARLLAAAMPSSFGHCGESGWKGRFTATVSKRARNWTPSQCEWLKAPIARKIERSPDQQRAIATKRLEIREIIGRQQAHARNYPEIAKCCYRFGLGEGVRRGAFFPVFFSAFSFSDTMKASRCCWL